MTHQIMEQTECPLLTEIFYACAEMCAVLHLSLNEVLVSLNGKERKLERSFRLSSSWKFLWILQNLHLIRTIIFCQDRNFLNCKHINSLEFFKQKFLFCSFLTAVALDTINVTEEVL